jgi:hypothetical protein
VKEKLEVLNQLLEATGQGYNLKSLYDFHKLSSKEVIELSEMYPDKVYINQTGDIYTDPVRIAYWKHKEGKELTEVDKQHLREQYNIQV